MNKNELSDIVFMKLEALREALYAGASSFIQAGAILREIFDAGLYPKSEGFYSFITDNVGIGRSSINDMMAASRRFGHIIAANPDLKGIFPSKLRLLLPHVKDNTPDDDKLEMLQVADALSVNDLKLHLRERVGKPVPETCTHSGYLEKITKCTRCGAVLKHTRDNYEKIIAKGTAFNPNVTDPLDCERCDSNITVNLTGGFDERAEYETEN